MDGFSVALTHHVHAAYHVNQRHHAQVAPTVRASIIEQICVAMHCTELVAECVLLSLMASVHKRQDESTLVLGKLGLNIFGVSEDTHGAVAALEDLLTNLLPSVHGLPMTLTHLNQIQLNPRKNTGANRIEAGLLQLTEGTQLVLDECVMESGTLNAQGVRNVTALGHLLQSQTVT